MMEEILEEELKEALYSFWTKAQAQMGEQSNSFKGFKSSWHRIS
jgi:hypothetical protein